MFVLLLFVLFDHADMGWWGCHGSSSLGGNVFI